MMEAILWDFGGVITTSPFDAFNRYEERHGLPRDFIRGVNASNPDTNAWAQFESNRVSLVEFDALFAAESQARGHRIPGREVIGLLYGDIRPRMVAALARCKAHYKLGCITNNVRSPEDVNAVLSAATRARVAEVMALFDVLVESSVVGLRKPDPRIYLLACERLGVAPERALFLDDLGINLKPARALGMRTIKVLSEAQALAELAAATGLDFTDTAA